MTSRRSGLCARSCPTGTLTRPSCWQKRAGAAWSVRCLPAMTRKRGTSSLIRPHGMAACWSSTGTARENPPATVRHCRRWFTAGPGGPAAEKSSEARGPSNTTCNAAAMQGSPTTLMRLTGEYHQGAAPLTGQGSPVPQVLRGTANRRDPPQLPAHRHRSGYRQLRLPDRGFFLRTFR